MIRITIEIDGVEVATAKLDQHAKPAVTKDLMPAALSGQVVEGETTAAGPAPDELAVTSDVEAARFADISDAGTAALDAE